MKRILCPTMKGYQLKNLPKDISTGIIIGAVSIPIAMGYAEVAGLSAVYGLYTSILPIILFALFSTSPQLIYGVDAAPAAIVAGTLASMGIVAGSEEALQTVPVITLFTALFLLLFAFLRAGSVLNYISTPVMGGFISGICATVIGMQIPKLLGGTAGKGEVFELIEAIIHACKELNLPSLLLGGATLCIILLAKKWIPKFPMSICVMAVSAVVPYFIDLSAYGVRMLQAVEPGLPKIQIPDVGAVDVKEAAVCGLTIAVVVMAETLLSENNFAFKNGYKIDDNTEILACGVGMLGAAICGCCPVNGSVSRTSMGEQYGGKSQLTGIVAGLFMVLVLLFGTGFIQYLPVPVLTAIVIAALLGVMEFDLAERLFKSSRTEFWIFVGSFLGVLVLGTIYGVVIGIVLSFVNVVIRAANPGRCYVGVIPGHEGFHNLKKNRFACPIDGTLIYRFSGNLFFANIKQFTADIESEITEDTKNVIIDAGGITSIDITAADYLAKLYKSLKNRGIRFYITEHISSVNQQMRSFGIGYLVEEGAVRRTITAALYDAGYSKPYPLVGAENFITDVPEAVAEQENSYHEFVWAFGDSAGDQMEKNIEKLITWMGKKDLDAVSDEEYHQFVHIWRRFSYYDEAELLQRLELHLRELSQKLGISEQEIMERIEEKRHQLAEQLKKKHPISYQHFLTNMQKLDERLKKEYPEEYAHHKEVLEEIKNKR